MVMIIFDLTYFFSVLFFSWYAMVHSVNTSFFFKEVKETKNRFTAMYFALHALQKSIFPEEKAVVILIHLV
jgi:hypothetical protein